MYLQGNNQIHDIYWKTYLRIVPWIYQQQS